MSEDGSTSVIYAVETQISQTTSVYFEVEIRKQNDNDKNLPQWETVGISLLDDIPEPIKDLIENPAILPIPTPIPTSIPVLVM